MKPQYMPKTLPATLGYLVEECGEVLAAVGKTQRWGPDSFNPELPETDPYHVTGGRETNRQWILREMRDLSLAIALVTKALESP